MVGATELLRLLLEVRACVVGASIRFRSGSVVLIGSTSLMMATTLSIEGRMIRRIVPHFVKAFTEICIAEGTRRIAEAVRRILRHN